MRKDIRLAVMNFCELITAVVSEDTQNCETIVVQSPGRVTGPSVSGGSSFCSLDVPSQHQGGKAGTRLCLVDYHTWIHDK